MATELMELRTTRASVFLAWIEENRQDRLTAEIPAAKTMATSSAGVLPWQSMAPSSAGESPWQSEVMSAACKTVIAMARSKILVLPLMAVPSPPGMGTQAMDPHCPWKIALI